MAKCEKGSGTETNLAWRALTVIRDKTTHRSRHFRHGGCLDIEFRIPSTRLLEKFKHGEAIVVVSELTVLELVSAPAKVRAVLSAAPENHKEYVEFAPEAQQLAERYLDEGVIGAGKRIDAQHIAMATISRVDVLVS